MIILVNSITEFCSNPEVGCILEPIVCRFRMLHDEINK